MSEQNKALVRRAVERIWNDADYAVLDQFVSEDFHIHGGAPGTEIHGREGTAQYFAALRSAFPDLRFSIDDQIAEGEHYLVTGSVEDDTLGYDADATAAERGRRTREEELFFDRGPGYAQLSGGTPAPRVDVR